MSIIGIDSGSTFVKIIETDERLNILHKMILKKMETEKAFDIFIKREQIKREQIKKIVVTGIGKDNINENIQNIETIKVDEFEAIATGGLFLAQKKKALIVSIGTGTALVLAHGKKYTHIGGTGVGGGTLFGLSNYIQQIESFNQINEKIEKGNINKVDIKIGDLTNKNYDTLPKYLTVSNFGKMNKNVTNEDMILGISNMIFEVIGMMAVLATKNINVNNIIIIGGMATIPYINEVLKKIEDLHKVRFIIPKDAEYGTVIGAIKSV